MFFGEVINKQNPFQISTVSKDNKALQLTNTVLDTGFANAELYLRAKNKDILLARLNPNFLQSNLNILIDLEEKPSLVAKNGNVHVCGHFTQKALAQNKIENLASESIINTNKKINKLSSQHIKEPTTKESISQDKNQTSPQQSQKKLEPLILSAPRQSSRISTRRASTKVSNPQKNQDKQKQEPLSKKDVKSQKKKQKSEILLNNGRYSLKALLQNVEDDQDDSDEQFSNSGQDEQSDDDSQFDDDLDEQDEDTISKSRKSQNKQNNKSIKRSKNEDEIQSKGKQKEQKIQTQQKQKTPSLSLALKSHFKPQIEIGQQSDSDNKKQINTQQYQQKWPETSESQIQKEANQRQQKISQLASKIKCPTKKPTI